MKKLVVKPDAEPIFFLNLLTKESVRKKEKVCRHSQAAAKGIREEVI